jgi:hypothetical protein
MQMARLLATQPTFPEWTNSATIVDGSPPGSNRYQRPPSKPALYFHPSDSPVFLVLDLQKPVPIWLYSLLCSLGGLFQCIWEIWEIWDKTSLSPPRTLRQAHPPAACAITTSARARRPTAASPTSAVEASARQDRSRRRRLSI